MARRKRHEEHENHERWLVSYADFITLLFAFFVVMYAVSSVNEGKYRVLSNTLTDAFLTQAQTLDPIQIGDPVRSPEPMMGNEVSIEEASTDNLSSSEVGGDGVSLDQVAESLRRSLGGFVDQDLVSITQTERGIEVEMKSKMLFKSGSARLSASAVRALRDVSKIIKPIGNQVHVEGHTDNVPIQTTAFPSNWELAAARAASVVHLFTRLGVDPRRLVSIGYGEYRPIADNESDEGRQRNRRVALIIMASQHDREIPSLVRGSL
ncbi:MAG: flagellar motor protein MotD [Chromatiales bacterium]|nr:flagellar motor protein MotD [Chromatiales bacterium]